MKFLDWKKRAFMGGDPFWLPSGINRENVIAAFQFQKAGSQAYALTDLTGNGYNLSPSSDSSWSNAGYNLPGKYGGSAYLNNGALNNAAIKCAVVHFTGLDQNNRGYLITAGGASGKVQIYAATSAYVIDHWNEYTPVGGYKNYGGPGFCSQAYMSWNNVGTMMYHGSTPKYSGVIGVNFDSNTMFLDGVSTSLSSSSGRNTYTDGMPGNTFGSSHSSKSDLNNARHAGKTLLSAVFFSVQLSAQQHLDVANGMIAINNM